MQFEFRLNNLEEFDKMIGNLKREGVEINDVYEKGYKILATMHKKQKRNLENLGIKLERPRED